MQDMWMRKKLLIWEEMDGKCDFGQLSEHGKDCQKQYRKLFDKHFFAGK